MGSHQFGSLPQGDQKRCGQEDRRVGADEHADHLHQRQVLEVPTPSTQTATTISAKIGMIEIRLVLIERMKVWLMARLACSAKVRRVVCSKPLVFSSPCRTR